MNKQPQPEIERDNVVVASLAVSLDRYVARLDGTVDFLEKYPLSDFDFDEWAERIGALVMGRTSYQQLLEWGWLWGDRPTLVLTSATDLAVPDSANGPFRSAAPTAKAIAEWSAQTPKRFWVFGSGNVVTAALLGGVVDKLDITILPEALGEGIPFFSVPYPGPMRIIHSVPGTS